MSHLAAIFLCDRTGRMAEPWAQAGVECWCVDIQHSIRAPRKINNVNFVYGDVRTWAPPEKLNILFVAAFPFCTHDAVCNARDFSIKGGAMLRDSIECFDACRTHARWSSAPYCVEHPVTILTSIPHIGKPNYYFHPWEYAGYLDDIETDNTTKKTCLWTGNGFVMPEKIPAAEPHRNDVFMGTFPKKTKTVGVKRSDLRAETHQGFARAVFEANAPDEFVKQRTKHRVRRVRGSKQTGSFLRRFNNN